MWSYFLCTASNQDLTEQKQQQNTPHICSEESKVDMKIFKMKCKVRRKEETSTQGWIVCPDQSECVYWTVIA